MAEGIGTATTLTHSGFVGLLTSLSIDGMEIPVIDTSHMGTTAIRTKIAGSLEEPGEISCEVQFEPDTKPTLGGTASSLVITFPDSSSWTCNAFLRSFSASIPLEELMTGTLVFQRTGAWS